TGRDLAAVRRRRAVPTAVTQSVQRVLHRLLGPILRGENPSPPKMVLRLVERLPWLSGVPAYFVGVGVRPERAPTFARRDATDPTPG
ncbi:MAG: FAD-dependent oxidoreductase, partial [Mycobacterium sp.]